MNVCTDQLLVSLADPAQILGLSPYGRDAWQALATEEARKFRVLSGGAEDVLMLKPDVVLASLFDKRSTRELLKAQGFRVAEFTVPLTIDEVRAQIRQAGETTGHPDRAEAAIGRLDGALARARQAVVKPYRVLPLSRRGWVDGLLGSVLAEIGLKNAAAELGLGSGGFASLESVIKLRPDFVLVSEAGEHAEDEGGAYLLHPALERFYPLEKRMVVPERFTVCGGAMLADGLNVLVKELKRVAR